MLSFKSLGLDLRLPPLYSLPRTTHIPPGRSKISGGAPADALFFDFVRFFGLPKWSSKFASKNHRKKCENRGFWPPKTVPKSIQNASENDVPTNMGFFIDFGSNFAACCKSRTSKFVRPRSVLLTFNTNQLFAFGMHFGSEKPTKNLSKTTSEPFRNRCQKYMVF